MARARARAQAPARARGDGVPLPAILCGSLWLPLWLQALPCGTVLVDVHIIAKPHVVAGPQERRVCLRHAVAVQVCVIDERAVPRAAIAQSHHAVCVRLKDRVVGGDGAAPYHHVVPRRPPDRPRPVPSHQHRDQQARQYSETGRPRGTQ